MSGTFGYDELRADTVRQVAKLMAAAAVTAPKSGGQLFLQGKHLFIETVVVDDRHLLGQLATWMRARGAERRERIWFRDAEVAEAVDAVLFIGLADWYPPNYDCGACGYATCAEFLHGTAELRRDSDELEFAGPHCNLRDIDLGIAVGSAAKTAALHSIDCRCQTRVAVAARKLGVIRADVAVALSLSLTHKAVGFDRRFPEVDFDALDLPATGVLPVGAEGGARQDGIRHRQQPRHPVRSESRPGREKAMPPDRHAVTVQSLVVLILLVVAGCSPGQDDGDSTGARVIELPGADDDIDIDFDDIIYSPALQRVLVPARESGLYLVEPDSGIATRVASTGSVASADEGRGLLFLADRSARTITVVDPDDGRTLSSVSTSAPPDYVRYIPSTGQLWVTEPGASPSGIEVFTVDQGEGAGMRPVGFVVIPEGPEGLTVDAAGQRAYAHAGSDLVVIDVAGRAVTARWPTGCEGTHGFPGLDERLGVVLASCAADGAVSLLDLDGGRQLGRYEVGGGEALPAHSDRTGHFYVRSDPGMVLATLQPSKQGLTLVREVEVPETGHCLTADVLGHYWTCDAEHGRVLRFDDSDRR